MFYLFFKRIVFVFLVQTSYNKYAIYTKWCYIAFCISFVYRSYTWSKINVIYICTILQTFYSECVLLFVTSFIISILFSLDTYTRTSKKVNINQCKYGLISNKSPNLLGISLEKYAKCLFECLNTHTHTKLSDTFHHAFPLTYPYVAV